MDNFRRRELLSSAGGVSPDGITYEYVDMGLSVKWATFDIGATKVGGYGKFFQWGDTQGYTSSKVGSGNGKKSFLWSDYKYCNGSYDTLTKYNTKSSYGTVDNKTVLESSDDAATFNMGKGWRMPTQAEYQELINACNQTWDSRNNWRVFTLKTDSTKKLIFPASGASWGGNVNYQGIGGFFWSSSLNTTTPNSGGRLYTYNSNYNLSSDGRYNGLCIRGVYREPGKPMPPMSVLFVNKNDTTQKQIFEQANWPSASDWTPIGIVVVPASHNRYGDKTNGIMSLGCLNSNGTMQTTGTTDNVQLEWGGYGTDTSLTNYTTCDGSNKNYLVQLQTNSSSTTLSYDSVNNIAYPYTDLTATEHNVITAGSLSDYDGVGNTDILNASPSTYIAAAACRKFYTVGTSAGDWYLPAAGELAYLPSIRYQVNDTITALNTQYGNVGVQLNTSNRYWSSSEYSSDYAWFVRMNDGVVQYSDKDSESYVRAFMRF